MQRRRGLTGEVEWVFTFWSDVWNLETTYTDITWLIRIISWLLSVFIICWHLTFGIQKIKFKNMIIILYNSRLYLYLITCALVPRTPFEYIFCLQGDFLRHQGFQGCFFFVRLNLLPRWKCLCSCLYRHIQDPASQRLTWNKPPVNVLVIRKIRDESLVEPFKELCRFLVEVHER